MGWNLGALLTEERPGLGESATAELPGQDSLHQPRLLLRPGLKRAGASALEGLGLRGPAGPLDWVRSSAQGVAQLLDQSFQGFLDLEGRTSQRVGDCTVLSASWEGSFWHHDVTQPEVREAMLRRTERFLGSSEANLVFLRVVNGSHELLELGKLHRSLQRRFPHSRVRLLALVDLQETDCLHMTRELGEDVLVATLRKDSWLAPLPTSPVERVRCLMSRTSEAYGRALAAALHVWARAARTLPVLWQNMAWLSFGLRPFHGGDPRTAAFEPRPLGASMLQALQATTTFAQLSHAVATPSAANAAIRRPLHPSRVISAA
ncbi:unnamed protein product [Effrenium voratum]|nr:unnamed protein product [Effrenium voratum]